MKKILSIVLIFAITMIFTGPAHAGQSYSIKYTGSAAQWGNYCQSVRGVWICIAEVQVVNKTGKMINPRLTAQLIDTKGRTFTATDSRENKYLTGVFANNYINPSESVGWAIHFTLGANVRFKELQILEGRKKVATLKYTCASTMSGAFC